MSRGTVPAPPRRSERQAPDQAAGGGGALPGAFGTLTSPDAVARADRPLVIPVGSLEQHGPHLPLDTDTRVAQALAGSLAAARHWSLAPAVAYGASGEHAGFPGTLSVGTRVLTELAVELVRSARDSCTGVVVVSGHGGNREALVRAEERSRSEGDRVLVWHATVPGGDAHAGRTETSLLLALAPETVHLDRAVSGCTEPLAELLPVLRAQGVRAVSSNGVLGDPAGATAAEGHRLLASLRQDLLAAADAWAETLADPPAPTERQVQPVPPGAALRAPAGDSLAVARCQ